MTDAPVNRPDDGATGFLTPFRLEQAALRTFLEVPIVADPTYRSIEMQEVEVRGERGLIVLLTTTDGRIDAYADESLGLDEDWFRTDGATANTKRGLLAKRRFSGHDDADRATLTVETSRVSADLSFTDEDGRAITVSVVTARPTARSRRLNIIPAPSNPVETSLLPFLVAPEFWLLPRAASISVSIDGIGRAPSRFPVPVGFRLRFYARFATDLQLISLNPDPPHHQTWPMPTVATDTANRQIDIDRFTTYVMTTTSSFGSARPAIDQVRSATGFAVTFTPPVPVFGGGWSNPAGLSGTFAVDFDRHTIGRGRYSVTGKADAVDIELTDVVQRWRPPVNQPSLVALAAVRRYTRRGRAYRWRYRAGEGPPTGAWSEGRTSSRPQ